MMSTWPLVTPRLVLRAPVPASEEDTPGLLSDAADLAERRSDPGTALFQAWAVPYPLDRAEALVRDGAALGRPTPGSWFQPILQRRSDGRVVGDLAVHVSANGRTAQVGWTLHTWARGQGYATEGAVALCDHLVLEVGVHRLEAHIHPGNHASRGVLSRLGFRSEGVLRESFWVEDEVSDDEVFGLLAREWPVRDR